MSKKLEPDGRAMSLAWNQWLGEENGLKCSDGTVAGEYLRNRLEYAFYAGYEAGFKAAIEDRP